MDPRDRLDRSIRSSGDAVDPNGAVCTGWVVIAEWQDSTGRWWVTRWADANMPPWRADGLLYHATQNEDLS